MRVSCEAPDGPLRQGWPSLLTVGVENSGAEAVVLDAAWGDALCGRKSWRTRPLGAVVYDAGRDRYRHVTHLNTRSVIPLDQGLLPPPESQRWFDLALKSLALGEQTLTIRVAGWRIPPGELDARVYLPPDPKMRQVVSFLPLPEVRAGDPAASDLQLMSASAAVVRTHGCERIEAEATVAVTVEPDAGDPAEAALERAGGGQLVQRCRRLKGAWLVEAGDVLHLLRGEEHLRLKAGTVAPEVWTRLDDALPFEPALVLFVGEAAAAIRARIPSCEDDRVQQQVAPGDLLALLREADAAGLRVGWGRHSAVNEGLVLGRD